MIQAIVPVSTQKHVMQEATVEGKSSSSPYTIVNNCTTFSIDSEEHHQRHKTVVAPPISSMNAASQACDPDIAILFPSQSQLQNQICCNYLKWISPHELDQRLLYLAAFCSKILSGTRWPLSQRIVGEDQRTWQWRF